ncbi:MAG: Teichoic acid translocation permease protein TagG [Syntrophorhabdus sp. PtaU1.Bin002]|nr:MAG: Teichoic acid translocation permease protein TagG [Syntrophorhabdus sp. PtaB.Bin006]OPY68328.1 MAG: Teichoic acid translocation permease protein TagG [Syntrophorhabdus sp. PtaU1.Bin002]
MLRAMAVRELKATYVGSFFGFFWAVLNPVSQILIYGIVFGYFFKGSPPPQYGTDSYFLYLVAGLIPWQFFAQTVGATTNVLLSYRNLIKRAAGFPSEVLPIVTVISNLISALVSICLLFVIVVVFTRKASLYMMGVFVYLFLASVICVGIGWILSSLTVFLRDIPQVIGLALTGMFFFTPIFYSPTIVPPKALLIMKLNPMYHVIEGYRLAVLAGKSIPAADFAYLVIASLFILGMGGLMFRKLKPEFAEVM